MTVYRIRLSVVAGLLTLVCGCGTFGAGDAGVDCANPRRRAGRFNPK